MIKGRKAWLRLWGSFHRIIPWYAMASLLQPVTAKESSHRRGKPGIVAVHALHTRKEAR